MDDFLLPMGQDLALIPIVVNAGAAAFPALIAGLVSLLGLIFRPSQWLKAIRTYPLRFVSLSVVIGLLVWGIPRIGMLFPAPSDARKTPVTATVGGGGDVDWSQVALELLRQEALQGVKEVEVPQAAPAEDGHEFVFRGGMHRSGYLGGGAPLGLVEKWRFERETALFLASPAYSRNTLFVASTYLDAGKSYGEVIALDAETGAEKWMRDGYPDSDEPFAGFFASPVISPDGTKLLIGQGLHPDFNMSMLCFDAQTGELLWNARTPTHVESTPLVAEGLAIVGVGAIEKGPEKKPQGDPEGIGHPGFVLAVDLETGAEVWRYNVPDPESSPAYADGVVFIGSGFNGEAVVALKIDPDLTEEERLLWRAETPYAALAAITLTETLALVGTGNSDFVFQAPNPEGFVKALDQKTGKVVWELEVTDSVLAPIAVVDEVAYISVRDGKVIAVNVADGTIRWESTVSKTAPVLSGCTVAENKVYIPTADGYLVILDAKNGEEIEKIYLNDEAMPGMNQLTVAAPLIRNGVIYTGSETGGIRAFVGTKGSN